MVERRLTAMIAGAAVLIVLFIFWDMVKPAPRHRRGPLAPGATSDSTVARTHTPPPLPVPRPSPPVAPETTSQGTTGPPEREPSYLELLARSETRRRIRASGSGTYLSDMLAAHGDSTLRRWDDRRGTPIRVWFTTTSAANFRPAFLDAIRSAFTRWTGLGVPVRFDFNGDSTSAEVTVRWRVQFEIERTGQTDVTWDQNGAIQGAVVTFATLDPKGRPLEPDDVRVVALHEVGHVLGLDHSTDSTDIMFPTAKVRDLSNRDVRTAVLLYQLTPGSLR